MSKCIKKCNNLQMDSSYAPDKREMLKSKIRQSKNSIEAMLKQYKYQPNLTVTQNMKKLGICLQNIMNVQGLQDFVKFISNQEHLPIQVNLKALKYENLLEVFQDWLNSTEDHSTHLERNLTHLHRSILFKQIFIQQKQTIKDFFDTLSDKQKLKDINLFQLLTQLLSHYYLYEYNADTESFFQKVNSFQNFLKVVQAFIKSGRRVYTKDKTNPNDQNYIRLHEFEQLIQFWENFNPQLTIQQQPRKNKKDISIQTNSAQILASAETQTERQASRSYLTFINAALFEINTMISKQNDPQMLASLDILFDALRSQKMFAINVQQQNKQKRVIKQPSLMLDSNYSQTQPIYPNANVRVMSPNKNRVSPRKTISSNRQLETEAQSYSAQKQQEDIKNIYKHLCSQDTLNCLTISELQIFFYKIGLTKAHENTLITNLLNFGFIEDKDEISLREFKKIIKQLMKESRKMNSAVLKDYLTNLSQHQQLRKTAHFKKNSPRNNTTNFSKSQFSNPHNRSLLAKDSGQATSRTTFLLDSEGSYV